MSENIYISGGSSRINGTVNTDTRVRGTVDTDTRIKGLVDVHVIGVENVLFPLFILLLLLGFIFISKGRTERITVDGVDCVVISRSGISCDWQNAKPATPKKEGEQ